MAVRKVNVDTVFGVSFVELLGFQDKLLQDRVVSRNDSVLSTSNEARQFEYSTESRGKGERTRLRASRCSCSDSSIVELEASLNTQVPSPEFGRIG